MAGHHLLGVNAVFNSALRLPRADPTFNSCQIGKVQLMADQRCERPGRRAPTIGPATSIAEDLPLRQGGVIGRRRAQLWQIPCNAQSIRLEQTWELPLSSAAAVKAGIWEIQWLENSAAAAIGRRLPIKKLCSSTVRAVPASWKRWQPTRWRRSAICPSPILPPSPLPSLQPPTTTRR